MTRGTPADGAAAPVPTTSPNRRSVWIGGVVVGLSSGFLALTLPTIGYAIALLFIVGALLARGALPALGGLFLGFGSTWVALIANGALRCDPASCIPPNLAPWLAIGLTLVIVGGALSVAAARRGDQG